jgi:hypothetical protein
MRLPISEISEAISAHHENNPSAAAVAERCGYLIAQLEKVYTLEINQGGTEAAYAIGDVMNLLELVRERA